MNLLSTLLLLSVGLAGPLRAETTAGQGSLVWAPVFDSELAAVLDAVNLYNPVSVKKDVEYMGAVYKHAFGRTVRYGYTVGMGEPGKDTVTISVRLPIDSELLAFWHTHGASHWTRNYFSDIDTKLARDWGLPFYLATAQGELHVFQPGDRVMGRFEARRLGLGERSGYASGRAVGTVRS